MNAVSEVVRHQEKKIVSFEVYLHHTHNMLMPFVGCSLPVMRLAGHITTRLVGTNFASLVWRKLFLRPSFVGMRGLRSKTNGKMIQRLSTPPARCKWQKYAENPVM